MNQMPPYAYVSPEYHYAYTAPMSYYEYMNKDYSPETPKGANGPAEHQQTKG